MGSQEYNAGQSGNWTIPTGVTSVTVTMYGGGGTGAYANAGVGGGGGAGVIVNYTITGLTPGNTIAYSVGNGGAAISYGGSAVDGNSGSNTTFGILTAYAGLLGHLTSNHNGGNGGNATDGSSTANGGAGGTSGDGGDGQTVAAGGGNLYGGGGGGYGSTAGSKGGKSYNTGQAAGAAVSGGGGSSYAVGIAAKTYTNGSTGAGTGGDGNPVSAGVGAGGPGHISLTWTVSSNYQRAVAGAVGWVGGTVKRLASAKRKITGAIYDSLRTQRDVLENLIPDPHRAVKNMESLSQAFKGGQGWELCPRYSR